MKNQICFGNALDFLCDLKDESVDLIYTKPPTYFEESNNIDENTLKKPVKLGKQIYTDLYDQYLLHLEPRLIEAHRVLTPHGTLYFHTSLEYVHYCKALLLDEIFTRDNFLNEIIWAFEGQTEQNGEKWPIAHENILVYAKTVNKHKFNLEAIDRIPYIARDLVGQSKAKTGKLPTDTWWYTQRTSLQIIQRIISASSNPDNLVLDPFAGVGNTAEACFKLAHQRQFILIEDKIDNLEIMAKRFENEDIEWVNKV